ncbi:hypothetical protein KW782_02935 [Candidatus Parcubacteria bacterium]|nr:hypothetical protein [Candidatus Parcubacteria bacterium]
MLTIITCRRRNGFVAKVVNDEKFEHWGKTRAEAVGRLILDNEQRLKIIITWDMSDEETGDYFLGKGRKGSLDYALAVGKFPKASGKAHTILVSKLPLLIFTKRGLSDLARRCETELDKMTLGHICTFTEAEVQRCSGMGSKRFSFLKKILEHYGLSLKTEAR